MHPQLIPGLPIQTFGLLVAIGFWLCWYLLERLTGRKDLSEFMTVIIVSAILGARLAHVVEYWHQDGFDRDFLRAFQIWNGGLVFYGGFIAATLAFLVWAKLRRVELLGLMDVCCVLLPLGHAFGRIGCFCYGCCWGKPSDSVFAVAFPAGSPAWYDQLHAGLISRSAPVSLPVLPTQLFESVALFALFAGLYLIYRRFRGWTAAGYLLGYGVIRFLLEFLRDDDRPVWGGLSSAQNFSLVLIGVSAFFFLWSYRHHCHGQRSSDHR